MTLEDSLSESESSFVWESAEAEDQSPERDNHAWDAPGGRELGDDIEDEEPDDEEESDDEEDEDEYDSAVGDLGAEPDLPGSDSDLGPGELVAGGLGAALGDDMDSVIDDDDDDDEGDEGEDEDGDGDGDGDGTEAEGAKAEAKEGEADAAAPQRSAPSARVIKKPVSKKTEADEEVNNPDTPVPSKDKMLKALEWAFESEDEVTPDMLGKFCEHALFMLKKNSEMNLTKDIDPKELAAKVYLDSWRITRLVPLMARRVLDLGSGGGYPGIPLAIAEPNLSMLLLDSTRTHADFMEESIKKLGLRNCRALWDRAEEYLATERVDVVVVRAVSSVRENVRVLRKVRHSMKDVVMLKGKSWSREVRAAEREAERLGFKLDTVWEHELPGEMGQRAILVYRAPGGAGL
ncbi:MAG: 16S rRNA (guanine527-N7)-methyltransferase [Planctomycetota bacterium]|jgi:16S rRNA (guanine527-N7)-methyltransferase